MLTSQTPWAVGNQLYLCSGVWLTFLHPWPEATHTHGHRVPVQPDILSSYLSLWAPSRLDRRKLGVHVKLSGPPGSWNYEGSLHRVICGSGSSWVLSCNRLVLLPWAQGPQDHGQDMYGPAGTTYGPITFTFLYFLIFTKIVVILGTVQGPLPLRPWTHRRKPSRLAGRAIAVPWMAGGHDPG